MTEQEVLRERLARLESDGEHAARMMDQHAMILSRHSSRILSAEQHIQYLDRRQTTIWDDVIGLKASQAETDKDKQRRQTLIEAGKWIAGGVVLVAVVVDAIPNNAAGILRAWLGLP